MSEIKPCQVGPCEHNAVEGTIFCAAHLAEAQLGPRQSPDNLEALAKALLVGVAGSAIYDGAKAAFREGPRALGLSELPHPVGSTMPGMEYASSRRRLSEDEKRRAAERALANFQGTFPQETVEAIYVFGWTTEGGAPRVAIETDYGDYVA